MSQPTERRERYRDRLRAMTKTRRYKFSLAVIAFAVLVWCAINAALVIRGISSGVIRTPETMTRAEFLVASVAYWVSLPLFVGVAALALLHLVLPYLVVSHRYDEGEGHAINSR